MSAFDRDVRSQTQAIQDVNRSLVHLDGTLFKLFRALERSNQIEDHRVRDIQVQNRRLLEKEIYDPKLVLCKHSNVIAFKTDPPHKKCVDCGALMGTVEIGLMQ